MFKNKNLLIVSPYPCKDENIKAIFVKVQVDVLKKYFNKVIVISPTEYFPKFLARYKFIPKKFRNTTKFYDYKYDNVEIYYPRYFTLPLNYFRNKNGKFAYSATLRCIKKNDLYFDLIHAHFTNVFGYVGIKLKEKYKKKVVLTTHGLHHSRINDMVSNKNAKYVWNNTDLIINVSHQCINLLKEWGYSENNLRYVPNMVDLNEFQIISDPKDKLNFNIPNKNIIVSIGHLYKKKGFKYLIESLNILKNERKDFFCFIIGRGHLEKKLKDKIKRESLEEYIKLIGPRPHSEIPLWMNVADLFVLNSFVENFGVVNIEALACGTPVVSTINGGSEEIIISEDSGYLIDNPKNVKELALKINLALKKHWDKNKLISYTKKFEKSNVIENITKIYEKLLK